MLLLTVLAASCASSRNKASKAHFEIISATRQDWSGGIASAGTGTHYRIEIITGSRAGLQFDTLWLPEFGMPLTAGVKGRPGQPLEMQPGDTVVLSAKRRYPPANWQMLNDRDRSTWEKYLNHNLQPPRDFKGAALIQYRMAGKPQYRSVPKLVELEEEQYR